jgi:Na+-translocating ferredoxin:NAD+ oxidoreductase RnfD subunit
MNPVAVEIIPVKNSIESFPKSMFGIDSRFVAPILITMILLGGQFSFGILESFLQTAIAIITSIIFEIALSKLTQGKFPHLASAYISGISVGILVRSPDIYWTFALCAAISITSKYVLRVKDRHIWNPSNFGICAMLFLAPYAVASLSIQWGNNLYAMMVIWFLGSVIIYRLKRFHITLTYVLSFLVFSFIRSLWTGDPYFAEIAPITGAMYQLYIFFMITDPKTTVRSSKSAQILVVIIIALVEMILRLFEVVHAPYYALFTVGPIANLIDIYLLSPKTTKESDVI